MKVKAELNNLRIAPRKVRLISNLIKGLEVEEALFQIKNTVKRSCIPMEKLINSAIANAENNFGLDRNNLYIDDIKVGDGVRLKRWMPKAYGRATPILKRNSRVFLTLSEIEEGKNRKSKQQLEKERKERELEKDKMRKEIEKEREGKEKVIEKVENSPVKMEVEEEKSKGSKGGWVKKIFRRKSF